MRLYRVNDGWAVVLDDMNFTTCMLQVSETHAELAPPLMEHAALWAQIDAERQAAELGVVRANAGVAWCDGVLDRCTKRFGTQLHADCDGNRDHSLFTAFFPVAPAQVTKQALESQLDTMQKFPQLAKSETLKKPTRALLQLVLDAMERGAAAVKARETAQLAVAAVARKQIVWREDANRVRRGAETALDDYANKNDLPRDYAAAFFAAPTAPKKSAEKAPEPVTRPVVPQAFHALSEGDQVLALPDAILRGLAEEFVATLPANVQSIVRARRAG